MILGFGINSNSLVHLPFLLQSLAEMLPSSRCHDEFYPMSGIWHFCLLTLRASHVILSSVYESPRWGLVKMFHENMAEKSRIQVDHQLCMAKSPTPKTLIPSSPYH